MPSNAGLCALQAETCRCGTDPEDPYQQRGGEIHTPNRKSSKITCSTVLFESAVPKRGPSKRGRTQKHANERKRAQMRAKERKRKSAKEHKRAQKGAKERKRA